MTSPMIFLRSFLLLALLAVSLQAAVPVPYAGKVSIDGVNFNGSAAFAFEIRDAQGTAHWRNGSTPNDTISVSVANGRYLVHLGGQGMNPLPSDLFLAHEELYLKVRFDPGDGQGLRLLGPDQRITATPYALAADLARTLPPGAVTLDLLSPQVLSALGVTPSVSTQPFARYDPDSGTVLLEVVGRGHNLGYQWFRNGQPISGATGPILEIANANLADSATYLVRLTNSLGQVSSQTVSLQQTVGAPGPNTSEGNSSQVPSNGLVLWLDANGVDADGVADSGTDQTKVANWADKAGKDHNATQGTPAFRQPTIRSNQLAERQPP